MILPMISTGVFAIAASMTENKRRTEELQWLKHQSLLQCPIQQFRSDQPGDWLASKNEKGKLWRRREVAYFLDE